MGVLPFLLLAKAAADERRRQARYRSRMRDNKTNNSKSNHGSSKSKSYEQVSYLEAVAYEIKTDDSLKTFFDTLMKHAQSYRMEQGKDFIAQGAEIRELISKYKQGLDELAGKIQESGIELGERSWNMYEPNGFELMVVDNSNQREYVNSYNSFNGIRLNLEELANPGFQERFDKQKAKCDEIRIKREEAAKKLKTQETLDKFFLFQTEKRYQTINRLRREISLYDKELEKEEELRSELETFKSFSPEQLKMIKDYLEAKDCVRKATNLYDSKIKEYFDKIPELEEKDVVENALDRTMQELGIGQEDIAEIYRKLDKVAIKRFRGEYDAHSWEYRTRPSEEQRKKGTLNNLLSSFIKNIYEEDPSFVERNMDQVIEDAKSRDDE